MSDQAVSTAKRVLDLFERDRQRISTLGKAANSVLRIHRVMERKPIANVAALSRESGLTKPTVESAIRRLTEMSVVDQLVARKRYRMFVYNEYFSILKEGTEPIR